MTFQSFLIKYGEIGLKGKNRHLFEDALVRQIRHSLKPLNPASTEAIGKFQVYKAQGRIYIDCPEDYDYEEVVEALQRVFGIVGICPVVKTSDQGFEQLQREIVTYIKEAHPAGNQTFKVEARRSRKNYPLNSMEINCELGATILDAFPDMRVDVHKPEIMLHVEIRELIYIYSTVIPGLGGMPVGTNGSAMLLLSGGIDSPVAGYMIAKRGVSLHATYFHAPPYTGERAKEKVVELARQVARYAGPIQLHVVNFTEIQLYIYEQCPHAELTIIMRRYMMRMAERLAEENDCLGLITGESIGQVASQTMQSLAATDAVCTMPVYRPLIGFDKRDIVELARRINTFETSILPYEDCCTIFVAKHPATKPIIKKIEQSELALVEKIDELVEKAIESVERIYVK